MFILQHNIYAQSFDNLAEVYIRLYYVQTCSLKKYCIYVF